MKLNTQFSGDDVRKIDPKFQQPRYAQYLKAVERLDRFAQENFGKHVLELAMRWTLDQPFVTVALWGARHPKQLTPVSAIDGWKLDAAALKAIDEDCSRFCHRPGWSGVHGAPARPSAEINHAVSR